MRRALCLLPDGPNYRAEAFRAGLARAGFGVGPPFDPAPGDALLIWNRYPRHEGTIAAFKRGGADVLVVENGYFGKEWLGRKWFAVSYDHHNGAGHWPIGDGQRWDSFGAELEPWRAGGDEVVVLAQRGFGEHGVRMPDGWPDEASQRTGGRIRRHPGPFDHGIGLREDLARCSFAATWASGAALRAILMGVPVEHSLPDWIGAAAASRPGDPLFRGDRLPMLRRLAWAMWDADEIADGRAFACIFS